MIRRIAPFLPALVAAAVLGLAGPALAHTGAGSTGSFVAGFGHPLGGLDHLLAMIAVGLWAACLGDRARWFVPAAFVATMLAGALLGRYGGAWAPVEIAVALSVLLLGIAVALRLRIAGPVAMAVVGLFGLAHGHAHGAEAVASFSSYVAGFTVATLLLHAAGLAIGRLGTSIWAPRTAGAAIAMAGVVLLI